MLASSMRIASVNPGGQRLHGQIHEQGVLRHAFLFWNDFSPAPALGAFSPLFWARSFTSSICVNTRQRSPAPYRGKWLREATSLRAESGLACMQAQRFNWAWAAGEQLAFCDTDSLRGIQFTRSGALKQGGHERKEGSSFKNYHSKRMKGVFSNGNTSNKGNVRA